MKNPVKFIKQLILLFICVFGYLSGFAQSQTLSNLTLTAPYDQIRFIIPGEFKYYLMSKPSNGSALGLYSPDNGGWYWRIKQTTGDFVLQKGNLGVGTADPVEKLNVFSPASGVIGRFGSTAIGGISGLRLQGKNTSSANQYLDIAFDPATGMYGFGVGSYSSQLPINGGMTQADFVIDGNGNMGLGTISPKQKLHVKGGVYIDGTETSNGWNISRLQWKGHSLVMGSEVGRYSHNKLELKPGGSSNGALNSIFEMYTSPAENQHDLRISIRASGTSYFNGGNVAIGTTETHGYKLAVAGKMITEEVVVKLQPWPDYVFETDYPLTPLQDLEIYLKENKHLPNIPTAKEAAEEGIKLGEMNAKLLEKVEELTLYLIRQNKLLEQQAAKLEEQEKRIASLENGG